MAWVRLSDDFTEHPKLLDAGPLAGWLWVSALAWSNRNGTDGRIPLRQVGRLVSFDGVGVYTGAFTGDDVDPHRLADVLVDVGLFEPVEGGYMIHDYDEYQLTTEELAKRREQKSAAGRKGADARWHSSCHSTSHGSSHGTAMARIPYPEKTISSSSSSDLRALPDDLWTTIADKKLAKQKPGSVSNPQGWRKRVVANDKNDPELIAKAHEMLEYFDLDTPLLADAVLGDLSPQTLNMRRRVSDRA